MSESGLLAGGDPPECPAAPETLSINAVSISTRNDPARAISYAEEVIVYLIIWAIMIVSSQLVRQDGHVRPDVVLVFVTARSVENFARGKFTLGADASVAAGPVGRQGEAAAGINAEIYSYSRSRGLFAGVALDGTEVAFDSHANDTFYHSNEVTTTEITGGKVTTTDEAARRFLAAVATSANATGTEPAAPSAPPPPAAPPAAAAPPPPPSSSGGVKTYPMEDSQPGSEPK